MFKQKQIEEGKIQGKLSPLEQKILDLCDSKPVTTSKFYILLFNAWGTYYL